MLYKLCRIFSGLVLVCFFLVCWVDSLQAIPTFARKYETSCTTCHSPVPIKLNNFGKAFKDSGYRMPSSDEALVKQPEQQLGAEAWKELWPNTVWPGAIPSAVPLSVQIYLDARYDPHNEAAGRPKKPQAWFDVPHEVEVMTAGTSGTHVSWWANVEFKNDQSLEIVQAWGQFDNILDLSLLNLRMGRLEPRAVPFSRTTQRFLANDFLTTEFTPSVGGAGRHNFKSMQSGIELWGVQSIQETGGGVQYAVGLLNGGGPKVADEVNNAKDFYLRLAYKVGGMGVGRSIVESSELKETKNWIDESIRVGFTGYKGKWAVDEYSFSRLVWDLDVWFKTLNLYTIFSRASDDGKLKDGSVGSVTSNNYAVGVDWISFPWLTAIVRYESAKYDQLLMAEGYKKSITRIIPAVVAGIRPNIVWVTEFVAYLEVDDGSGKKVPSGDDVLRTRVRFVF